jgi:hypothetical protein
VLPYGFTYGIIACRHSSRPRPSGSQSSGSSRSDPHVALPRRDPRRARPRYRLRHRLVAVFAQRQDGERVRTKTRAGRRTIDVGPQGLKLLREQQLARPATPDGYLFPSPSGAPFDGDNFFARVFKPAACHARMPELTFHDLRHTGASLMIASAAT